MPKSVYLGAAVLWTLAILVLCLVSFNNLPKVSVSGIDKYVHAGFHFGFTVLWYLYLRSADKTLDNRSVLAKILACSLVFGSLIELIQGVFTETRSADWMDIAANFAGTFLAAILLYANRKWIRRTI